jgi:hypothetical protein
MDNIYNFIFNSINVAFLTLLYLYYVFWKYKTAQNARSSKWLLSFEVIKHSFENYSSIQKSLLATVFFVSPGLLLSYNLEMKQFRILLMIVLFIYLIYENSNFIFNRDQRMIKSVITYEYLLALLGIVLSIQNLYLIDRVGATNITKSVTLLLLMILLILRMSSLSTNQNALIPIDKLVWSFAFIEFINVYTFSHLLNLTYSLPIHLLIFFVLQILELYIISKLLMLWNRINFRLSFINNATIKLYIIFVQVIISMKVLL